MDIRWTQVGLTIDESYVVGWRSGGGGGRKEEGEGNVGWSVAWGGRMGRMYVGSEGVNR